MRGQVKCVFRYGTRTAIVSTVIQEAMKILELAKKIMEIQKKAALTRENLAIALRVRVVTF